MRPSRPAPPTLRVREWSRATPWDTPLLRDLTLTAADRRLLDRLARRTSLRIEELRQGLLIEIGPHIGVVTLSGLRLVVLPKLRLDALLAMIAYALQISPSALTPPGGATAAGSGLTDLLGWALVQQVEGIARGGLLACYQDRREELTAPRGRIDLGYAATRPKRTRLRCEFHELTADHRLNRVLAAGLYLASDVVQSAGLRLRLRRCAESIFRDLQRIRLDSAVLAAAQASLDRRSRHYQTALTLVVLIFQGSGLDVYRPAGGLPAAGFLWDMNRLFESFLTRYLQRHAPPGVEVIGQTVHTRAFTYLENPGGWREPAIRPDLVFRRQGRTIALGDAKYKDYGRRPPAAQDLYQLTTYGLAYPMTASREVILFYPLESGTPERPARLLFTPGSGSEAVHIRLAGVPIDAILAGRRWWPLPSH